jgi:ribonuclease HI
MLEIWTDGSCAQATTKCGGWGVIISNGVEFGGYLPNTTNQRAEIQAVLEALRYCKYTNQKAIIYSDSTYVVNSCTKWGKKWSSDGWKKVIANKDLMQQLYPLYVELDCELRWCKGHSGVEGNEKADKLAVYCREEKMNYNNIIEVSKESADKMMEILDNPPPPNEKLIEAAKRHKEMVDNRK